MAIFVGIKRPFKSRLANWTLIINNINYTIVLILFYIINTSDEMTQKSRYNKLGTPCAIFICIILLINVGVGIVTMIELVKDACRKRKIEARAKLSAVNVMIKKKALAKSIKKAEIKKMRKKIREN